ncbi:MULTISPECIES: hypothetical protein [Legionella]|uniref:Uncharacterized protein n=1 Tax=Legionella steelei TaxID=947033 RepID=A0A0W0ZN87_9GAMM|nr:MULTISPECIES: hypothetical protein [Legionella]KTD70757.1 hypothetical protein Lste_0535 [Legionella steelei]MBN9227812.1 hypothetical protein [Legionella steelei]OJW05767.1 MAG: hypothetical protein BGO44_02190 [Legionella sp. 39-23]
MYRKVGTCLNYSSALLDVRHDQFIGTLGSSSNKILWRKFIQLFCIILFLAMNTPSWAHSFRGGGFHEHGGFPGGGFSGGGFSHGAEMYHQNNNYHTREYSGGYRENEYYHGFQEGPSFGQTHHTLQRYTHPVHPFNHTLAEINHPGAFHHNGYINKEFAGNANWMNHGNWHSGYWHNGYNHYWAGRSYWGSGPYWGPGYYWGPGPYWGWGNDFFFGAFFGAAITTTVFFPPVYTEYYYPPPMYYYPGPYNYTVLISDYSVTPVPPLRPAPQKVEKWVPVKNGRIPVNAVTNNIVNKRATYYCRVKFHGKLSYGVLVPHDGCYIEEPSVSMRFSKYDILVSSIIS